MTDEEQETQKALEKCRKMNKWLDLQWIDFAIGNLACVCRNHSCSDCPLDPREATKCAYILLKEQYDYLQAKKWSEKK